MFLGKFAAQLDDSERLAVPAAFRADSIAGLFVMQGLDRNLMALTTAAFEAFYQHVRSLNLTDPLARLLLRLVLGSAHQVRLDEHGTFRIPSELAGFAHLTDRLTLVGQGDYFEIWSTEVWQTQESLMKDAASNANRFSALTVATR